ncbi:hypothetical protein LCGC14_1069880 [marine sediment metagenome]|uniref:Uncharacterized protein n=1 Tax=marine sediment metagenome TaxID=412755 RepID=A0A0F9MNH0_9ZZZZ
MPRKPANRLDCTSCSQRPVTNPEHKERGTGLLLCEECYCGMDQTLDEHGNIRPEVLFYTGSDDDSIH